MISLEDKRNKKVGEYVVQFSKIMGNHNRRDNLYHTSFFTMFKRSIHVEEGPNIKEHIWFYFKNIKEANNFLSYCKTDFVRMCLILTKNCQTVHLKTIPWMDFTQEWNDKKLYKHFNISQQEQDFIKEVIPKYYD